MNKPEFGSAEIAEFKEDIAENMRFLENNFHKLSHESDRNFVESLCDYYSRSDSLSAKQLPYALKFWRLLKNLRKGTGSDDY